MPDRTCTIEDCDTVPPKRRSLCNPHRYRRDRYGEAPNRTSNCETCGQLIDRASTGGIVPRWCSRTCYERGTFRPLREACMGCGGPMPTDRRRKYCTPACRYLHHRHGGANRPTATACTTCGATIDLTERMADGTLRRSANTRRCDWCMANARPHRYSLNAAQVAERDGTECKWCGEDVDLGLIGSRSKWAPSVDHIIPWSRGGTDNPENLQLMHRVCNAQKGTRIA